MLETSKSIREDFLHQNSFHEIDTYSVDGQAVQDAAQHPHLPSAWNAGADAPAVRCVPVIELPIRDEIARMRYVEETDIAKLDELETKIKAELGKLLAMGGEHDEVA